MQTTNLTYNFNDPRTIKICVVGLGYVGLPLARLFSQKYKTIGFDINRDRIFSLQSALDTTGEISTEILQESLRENLTFTACVDEIKDCNIFIVTVPTPVDEYNRPNLYPLLSASKIIADVLSVGNIVIYESTVYPGVTEEECVPVLEKYSGLKLNKDFFVGYSPERINPGDEVHTVEKIKKVTSGSTPQVAEIIDKLYNTVLDAGTHKAPSIKVAEASKIIENSQRDVNIAFMNELAKIFNAMDIDTNDVIEAASSKWNFIPVHPGLVGGHCIGVDPYYLIQKAQVYGVMPHIMSNARRLNDSMGEYVANQVIKYMNRKAILVKDADILILGFSFKENCADIRNTKVVDIYNTLSEYTNNIMVYDPHVDVALVRKDYNIEVENILKQKKYDAIILAVAHNEFLSLDLKPFIKQNSVVYDVKGVLPRDIIDARL